MRFLLGFHRRGGGGGAKSVRLFRVAVTEGKESAAKNPTPLPVQSWRHGVGGRSEAKQDEEGPGAVRSGGGGGGGSKVYHERQRMQFCLLHALNNLMQGKESFTRAEFDGIAENLGLTDPNKDRWTPISLIFNPHHNVLTGNYDVNVLIAALEARKKKVVWHDHRKGASLIDLDAEALVGLMINVPVRRLRGHWTGRHWVAIRSIDGIWFNLDSDFSSPKQFHDKEKLIAFLDGVLSQAENS